MSSHGPRDHGMRLALCCLYLRMYGSRNYCFPGQPLIADETGMGIRTISRHLVAAEAQGWVIVRRKHSGTGKWPANVYIAAVPDDLEHLIGLSRPDNHGGYEQEDRVETGKRSPRKSTFLRPAKLASRGTETVTLRDHDEPILQNDLPKKTAPLAKIDTSTSQKRPDDQQDWRANPPIESTNGILQRNPLTDTQPEAARVCAEPAQQVAKTATEVPATPRPPRPVTHKPKPDDPLEARIRRAADFLRAIPDCSDANVEQQFKITPDDVAQIRAAL